MCFLFIEGFRKFWFFCVSGASGVSGVSLRESPTANWVLVCSQKYKAKVCGVWCMVYGVWCE